MVFLNERLQIFGYWESLLKGRVPHFFVLILGVKSDNKRVSSFSIRQFPESFQASSASLQIWCTFGDGNVAETTVTDKACPLIISPLRNLKSEWEGKWEWYRPRLVAIFRLETKECYIALADTTSFKKMNFFVEWIFRFLKKWIFVGMNILDF